MQPTVSDVIITPDPDKPLFPSHHLSYTEWGNRSALHTLICVHGLTRNGHDFDLLAQTLSDGYRVICPDIAGRGKSDWLPAECYHYETYLAELIQLINALELHHVHWLGTSMGGILGMMVAGVQPGLIRSLILNDVGCMIPAAGLKRILSYAGHSMEFASKEDAEQHLRTVCAPFGITKEKHWKLFLSHSIHLLENGKARLHYDPAITAALQTGKLDDIDLWPLFESIKSIPTLLIRGVESDILPEMVAARMAEQHPNLIRYDVPNTGHAPALMAKEQINKISDWLKTVA